MKLDSITNKALRDLAQTCEDGIEVIGEALRQTNDALAKNMLNNQKESRLLILRQVRAEQERRTAAIGTTEILSRAGEPPSFGKTI